MKNKIVILIFAINILFFIGTFFYVNFSFENWNTGFINMDARLFFKISNHGYTDDYLLALFPLFPKLWAVLFSNTLVICLLNLFFISISFIRLIKFLNVDPKLILFYSIIPTTFFFYIPYSESLFFLLTVFLLEGILNNDKKKIVLSLFVLSLCRPSITYILIALIIIVWHGSENLKIKLKDSLLYVIVVFLGLLCVSIIQYIDSGIWFKFFHVQKYWGNEFGIPKLPFRSWDSGFILRLDGIAFLLGSIGGVLGLFFLITKKIKPKSILHSFAWLILGGITLSVLLFRDGSLFSLNRFIFCTPFIIFLIDDIFSVIKNWKLKQYVLLFVFMNLFWLMFGSYGHLQTYLKYLGATFILIISLITLKEFFSENKLNRTLMILGILILVELKIYFIIRFLNNQWIG